MFKIQYHRADCIGCGYCADVAPARWVMNENDGKATLAGGKGQHSIFVVQLEEEERPEAEEAAATCPVGVIRVYG